MLKKKKEYLVSLNANVPIELYDYITEKAFKEGTSRSNVVRQIIQKEYNKYKGEK